MPSFNPLIRERDVDFLLDDVLDVASLTRLPAFAEHDRETFGMFIGSARRLAREELFPAYRVMDLEPPRLEAGVLRVHPRMHALYPRLVELGTATATRPTSMGGQQLPLVISTLATAYLMAGNASAYGYLGLTAGVAHLLETFADDALRATYMEPLLDGRWTGTMALTEPQAGSSLADVATRATPREDGSFAIQGAKTFISGGDHDLTENIVHMTLARIDGAPPGTRGVSLFCVPKRRPEASGRAGALVDNDVSTAGMIHKIGWKGLPSCVLSFGERGDCRGWLVGAPHRGLAAMFQMMNEARIMVGLNGVATAMVAYHEALAYARDRPQGRPATAKDPTAPQIPIVEHADVRRMLLRQKAIAEGGLALVARTAMVADLAAHAGDEAARARWRLLLDLLTPIAKTFPAERGFEANVLAVQVHGGYGYSSEYLPESWLRDQKLNSIHEGTTGIQALDLLGRKVVAGGGAAFAALTEEIAKTVADARAAGVEPSRVDAVAAAAEEVASLTMHLAGKGLAGDVDGMLLHATSYLDLTSILVVAWQHLAMAAAARRRQAGGAAGPDEAAFLGGKLLSADHWIGTEVPHLHQLAALVRSGEDSHARVRPDEL